VRGIYGGIPQEILDSGRSLREFGVDAVWLDYHHSHASWEQAEPNMPDTCFCDRCLLRFQKDTAIALRL